MNNNNTAETIDEHRRIQQLLTDMLNFFHVFCVEHSITYYAAAGTALGAARHQGFIPWDDDIDIALPRPDYERLNKIFNNENKNKRFVLEGYNSSDSKFLFPYSKLYDTSTTLVEFVNPPLKRGLYLDIIPLDGAGTGEGDSRSMIKTINRLVFIRKMRSILVSKERSFFKNMIVVFFRLIPKCFFDDKKACLKIDRMSKRFDYESSKYVTCYVFGNGRKGMVYKSVFGKPTLKQFEGGSVYCPENVDAYLTHLYGNWRVPPPKDKQVTHHRYFLDLNTSYLE